MPSPGRVQAMIEQALASRFPSLLSAGAKIFYVNSSSTNDANDASHGQTPLSPLSTIDYAIGLTVAGRGDVVVVLPGHTETVSAAAGIDLDVAGTAVLGLGRGTLKPTISLGTATTATIRINAANCYIGGLRCASAIDSLVKVFDINADYATIEDCDIVGGSTLEILSFFNIATTKDFTTIRRCECYQATDPAGTDGGADTGGVYLVDSENVTIEDCKFVGNFETAIIHNRTTGATNLWVKRCFGIQNLSGAEPYQLVAAGTTGGDIGSAWITPAEAAVTEATLSGTLPVGFFTFNTRFGNDGGGGQNAVLLADAS